MIEDSSHNLKAENPIGIFDSGIGGLTVAHAIKELLPEEQLIYFGDTAHLPYGDKASYSIKHYSTELSKFLLEQGCKVIVIACHTASSVANEEVKAVVGDRALVINVVEPVIAKLIRESALGGNKVGIIGTKGTINSKVYPDRLAEKDEQIEVRPLATPLLCPMIEEGFIDDRISETVIESYLKQDQLAEINKIVLACTHYPLIKKQIDHYYQGNVEIIDSSEEVALHCKRILSEKGLLNEKLNKPHHFYVSDYTPSFEKSTRFFFGEKVKLEKGSIWS
jgi:glutamate racemase